jgi:hypothetical protein
MYQKVGSLLNSMICRFESCSPDYPWHTLSSPIVDIGGGIGALEMSILEDNRNNHLNFVIFDMPKTVEHANKVTVIYIPSSVNLMLWFAQVWSSQPPAISSHVSFVGGNFMAPSFIETQIPHGKPTYIIRHVLHDWSDDEAVHILNQVRQAMTKQNMSRLLLVEMFLCSDSSRFVRMTSMQTLVLKGVTRTQEEMEALVVRAGLKVARVTHMRAVDSVIEAVLE